MVIFMLIRGLFTPIESRPKWAQIITVFNLIRYFIEVMRTVLINRAGFKKQVTSRIKNTFIYIYNQWISCMEL